MSKPCVIRGNRSGSVSTPSHTQASITPVAPRCPLKPWLRKPSALPAVSGQQRASHLPTQSRTDARQLSCLTSALASVASSAQLHGHSVESDLVRHQRRSLALPPASYQPTHSRVGCPLVRRTIALCGVATGVQRAEIPLIRTRQRLLTRVGGAPPGVLAGAVSIR